MKSTLISKFTEKGSKRFFLLCWSSILFCSGFGQIAAYNVNSQSGFGTQGLNATTTDPNVVVGGLTRASGVTTSGTAASSGWGGNGFNYTAPADAITANAYIAFTISPNANSLVSLSNFALIFRRSSSGPTSLLIQYSINNTDFYDISTATLSGTSSSGTAITTISLSGISDLQAVANPTTITFRLVPFGASAAGGNFYVFSNTATTNAISITGSTVLPITLTSFIAQKTNTGNQISWSTQNAVNFDHFELERQTEGRTFSPIATIKLNSGNQYSYLDNQLLPSNNYYRLKMVDKDGSFTYSKIVAIVNTNNGFAVSNVYPTITKGTIIVEGFAADKAPLLSSIFSFSGQKVLEQSNIVDQAFKQNIDVSKLANGVYILKLSNGAAQTSYKIIKQ